MKTVIKKQCLTDELAQKPDRRTLEDYFSSLRMIVRLLREPKSPGRPSPYPGQHIRFRCQTCECRYRRDGERVLYEVPEGDYQLIRFTGDGQYDAAIVLPFVLEAFKDHLLHEIMVEVDHRWLCSEVLNLQEWDHEVVQETYWVDGPEKK